VFVNYKYIESIDSNLKGLDKSTDILKELETWIGEATENHLDLHKKIKNSTRYSQRIADIASKITEFAPSKKITTLKGYLIRNETSKNSEETHNA
jgi:hypothetical protein